MKFLSRVIDVHQAVILDSDKFWRWLRRAAAERMLDADLETERQLGSWLNRRQLDELVILILPYQPTYASLVEMYLLWDGGTLPKLTTTTKLISGRRHGTQKETQKALSEGKEPTQGQTQGDRTQR